jgi:hypothetical protein
MTGTTTAIEAAGRTTSTGDEGLETRIARLLNSQRLSAAPCPWLSAISIFVDEEYENYDYDMIGPRTRRSLIDILSTSGYRLASGNALEGPAGRLEFPRPTRTLGGDPAAEFERVVDGPADVAFGTPTQILLATWRREGPKLSPERKDDLIALVYEQPANLDKIADWLRRTDRLADFRALLPRIRATQREGTGLRTRGAFRSRLPR